MSWTKTLMMTALCAVFMTSYNCDEDTKVECTKIDFSSLNTSGTCATDADEDGICSEDEEILGTSDDEKDIFVEIDYMINSSLKGMEVTETALDLVKEAFAAQDINVHLDVGDLISGEDKYDPDSYNYCGGNEVDLKTKLAIDGELDEPCSDSDCTTMAALKENNFDSSREKYFHYAVIGQESTEGDSVAGLGEYPGQNFYVTLGFEDYNDYPQAFRDGNMALTLMHELGHNLYLAHGGDQDNNAKPNYQSIMNYAYGLGGLQATNSIIQWQQYITTNFNSTGSAVIDEDCGVEDNSGFPFDVLNSTWVLDFSDGSNNDLDENSVNDSTGFGTVAAADYNCDGDTLDNLDTYNLDDVTGSFDTLTDHDDWSNLVYDFTNFTGKPGFESDVLAFVDIRLDVYAGSNRTEKPYMLRRAK